MKFTRSELKSLIKEELSKQMKVQGMLQRKEQILTQLFEMYEGDTEFLTELGLEENIFKNLIHNTKAAFGRANPADVQAREAEFDALIAKYGFKIDKKQAMERASQDGYKGRFEPLVKNGKVISITYNDTLKPTGISNPNPMG